MSWPEILLGDRKYAVFGALSPDPDLGRIARILPAEDPRILLVRARDSRRPEFWDDDPRLRQVARRSRRLRLEG